MSNYGNPPQDPSGQPDPYGQPPTHNPYGEQPAYGQPGYGQQPAYPGQSPYGEPVGAGGYAHWGKRVGAYLIDYLLSMLTMIPYFIGAAMTAGTTKVDETTGQIETTDGSAASALLMGLGIVLYIAFFVWNYCIKQGRTGYTIGKGVLGIKLIKEQTGQPIGAGMSFVRQIAHIIDALPCYLGFLWPLWDAKRQTFADKIVGTVVIDQPKG